jgi:hypothetical protein
MSQIIWILYQNGRGMHGRVIGTFSSAEKAMNCEIIKEEIQGSQWRENHGLFICQPKGKKYSLTVEPSKVDRLLDDELVNKDYSDGLCDSLREIALSGVDE